MIKNVIVTLNTIGFVILYILITSGFICIGLSPFIAFNSDLNYLLTTPSMFAIFCIVSGLFLSLLDREEESKQEDFRKSLVNVISNLHVDYRSDEKEARELLLDRLFEQTRKVDAQ